MSSTLRTLPLLFVLGASSFACSATASGTGDLTDLVRDTGPEEDTAPAKAPEDTGTPTVEDTAPPKVEDTGAPIEDTAKPPPPICDSATSTYTATPTPHDVLFLLDRSGSMHAKVGSGTTRWIAARNAIGTLLDLISSPAAGGSTRAGLDMFPRGDKPITCCWIDPKTNYTDCDCKTGELPAPTNRCASTSYAPALVPLASLGDAQKALIKGSIAASDSEFYWGTPMKAALTGAIAKQATIDLDGVRSVVLITDGEPTSCNATDDKIDGVVSAAKAGFEGTTPVRTYVVGVIDGTLAANAANLSKVAVAGGTPREAGCEATNSCFYKVDAKTFEVDITKAFHDIEMKAFACTFDLPTLSSGIPDYDLVNITTTAPDGKITTVPRDPTKAEGWDFLPGSKKVQLYGAACTSVKADVKTKVEIVLGCKTVQK